MTIKFRTFDPEHPVDFDALTPPPSPSTTSCDCTCTFTKTIVTRVLASASHVSTVPPMPINTGCTRPSNPLDLSDVISKSDLRSFTLKELQAATCNFTDKFLLGEGGFGKVYKAILPDGSFVAIKRLSRGSHQGLHEFQAEIEISSRVRHRNLVPAIGFCVSKKPIENILVYPFKVNGDLLSRLGKCQSQPPLDWPTRKRILLGAARGLSCLHDNRIIHRDAKPSNILLDENLEACIGDFGIARTLDEKERLSSSEVQNNAALRFPTERGMATNWSSYECIETSRVVGTFGYMAPEYAMAGKCSVKIDVHSFGIIILEVVTGRKNNHFWQTENRGRSSFPSWIKSCLKENNLDMLIDSDLLGNCSEDDVKKIIQLGLACTLYFPEKRPSMHQVVQVLEGAGLEDIGTDTDYIMEANVNGFEGEDRTPHSTTSCGTIILPEELSGPR